MSRPARSTRSFPFEINSNSSVTVVVNNNGILSTPQAVNVSPFAPGGFAVQGYAVAIHTDGSLAAPPGSIMQVASHPAVPGETLQILATGLGPVIPSAITGNNSLDMLRHTVAKPTVLIGGSLAQVTFSGLSPQFVGVYQLNVIVPANTSPGDSVLLQIQIGGAVDAGKTNIAVGTSSWAQWGQNAAHTSSIVNTGQDLNEILANLVYDPLIPDETAPTGDLLVHYQVPLVDGNDVFMEFKSGVFDVNTYSTEVWGENRFTWQNGQLVRGLVLQQRLAGAREQQRFLGTGVPRGAGQRRHLRSGRRRQSHPTQPRYRRRHPARGPFWWGYEYL